MKSWKKRYFNLYNNGVLTYTSEASSTEILGEIDIKCAKIEIQANNHGEDDSPSTGRPRSLSDVFVGKRIQYGFNKNNSLSRYQDT